MANYIIDIAYILVAVIILAVFTKRGFVGSLFKLGKTIISCVLAYIFGPSLGELFYNKCIYNGIYNWVSRKIDTVVDGAIGAVDSKTLLESIPKILRRFINEGDIEERFNKGMSDISSAANEMAVSVSTPVAEAISDFLGYALVFVVSVIFLMLFGSLISALVKKIPVVKQIDKVLGFILGLVFMFIVLSLVTFAFGIVVSLFGGNETFEGLINASTLFEFFGKYNIIEILRS